MQKRKSSRFSGRLCCLLLLNVLWIGQLEASCIYGQPLSGESSTNGNVISWNTITEDNNDFFIIERSVDGLHFESAAEIDGAGTSVDLKQYRFLDISSNYSKTFYRLLQVDLDGATSLTHTIIVSKGSEESLFQIIALSASTTDRYFSMTLESSVGAEMNYRVMTKMGEVLKTGDATVIKGINAISIDLKTLEVGSYQLAVKIKNEIEVLNIQKLDSPEAPKINLANKDKN